MALDNVNDDANDKENIGLLEDIQEMPSGSASLDEVVLLIKKIFNFAVIHRGQGVNFMRFYESAKNPYVKMAYYLFDETMPLDNKIEKLERHNNPIKIQAAKEPQTEQNAEASELLDPDLLFHLVDPKTVTLKNKPEENTPISSLLPEEIHALIGLKKIMPPRTKLEIRNVFKSILEFLFDSDIEPLKKPNSNINESSSGFFDNLPVPLLATELSKYINPSNFFYLFNAHPRRMEVFNSVDFIKQNFQREFPQDYNEYILDERYSNRNLKLTVDIWKKAYKNAHDKRKAYLKKIYPECYEIYDKLFQYISWGNLQAIENLEFSAEELIDTEDNRGTVLFYWTYLQKQALILDYYYSKVSNEIFKHKDVDKFNLTQLHWAAACGKLEAVKELVKQGKDINAESSRGSTPLYLALSYNQAQIANFLLEQGAEVSKVSLLEWSYLHQKGFDSKAFYMRACDEILQQKDQKDEFGYTLLHWAVAYGELDDVKQLVIKGNDLNAESIAGFTPIYFAVQQGNLDKVKSLVELRATLNRIDPKHLSMYQKGGNQSIDPDDLEKYRTLLMPDSSKLFEGLKKQGLTTLLNLAVQNRDFKMAEFLLEKGCDVDVCAYVDKISPLHLAVQNNDSDMTNLIIKNWKGPENWKDPKKSTWMAFKNVTPLHLAVRNKNQTLVHTLLNNYAFDEVRTLQDGILPTHIAASYGETEMLANLKFQFNHKTADGLTPLHFAARGGHLQAVNFLLTKPGLVLDSEQNSRCVTPLHFAAENGHSMIAARLVMNGANIDPVRQSDGATPLHIAIEKHNFELTTFLLECGAKVDKVRKIDSASPLHIASQNGDWIIAEILLENNAKINLARTSDNATPIEIAVENGHWEIVELLLKKMQPRDKLKLNNANLLHRAIEKGDHEILALLLEFGLDVNQFRTNTNTNDHLQPLHIAIMKIDLRSIQILLENGTKCYLNNQLIRLSLGCVSRRGQEKIIQTLVLWDTGKPPKDRIMGYLGLNAIKPSSDFLLILSREFDGSKLLEERLSQKSFSWDAVSLFSVINEYLKTANKPPLSQEEKTMISKAVCCSNVNSFSNDKKEQQYISHQ